MPLIYPSSLNGLYARSPSESIAPHMWRGLIAAWVPSWGDTGRSLRDLSGYGHHGVIPNPEVDAGFVPSPGGTNGLAYRFSFDNQDWFQIAQTPVLDQATELTIVAQVRRAQVNAGDSWFIGTNDSDGYGMHWTIDNPGRLRFIGAGGTTNTGLILSLDTWYQCAVTCTDNGADILVKLYVDGVLQDTDTTTNAVMTMGADSLWLSKRPSSNNAAFTWDGFVGPILMYRRALGAQEIWEHHLDPVRFLRRRRQVRGVVAGAPPVGNAMPMAMNHYRRRRSA